MGTNGIQAALMVSGCVAGAQSVELGQLANGHVGAQVVRRGLVGNHVGDGALPHHLRVNFGGVAHQTDREALASAPGFVGPPQRFIQGGRHAVTVTFGHLAFDALGPHLHVDEHPFVHGHRQRLGAAHAA